MAKISKKNIRFREKNEMINDLNKILNLDVHYGTKFAVLQEITWVWTEFDGKYIGCHYWSEKALEMYENRKNILNFSCDKLFRHDHSVPRKLILKHLLTTKNLDEKYISGIFNKALVGAILTKEENDIVLKDTMPASINNKSINKYTASDKWARYKEKNIKIYEVKWQGDKRKKIIEKKLIVF